MPYRTFFLMRRDNESGELLVDSRTTYVDISERLVVAQVDARMDGTTLTEQTVRELFPEALEAASTYQKMKLRAAADPAVMGPYRITTEETPDDQFLRDWFESTHKKQKEVA
jgi:hypothetical protein